MTLKLPATLSGTQRHHLVCMLGVKVTPSFVDYHTIHTLYIFAYHQ